MMIKIIELARVGDILPIDDALTLIENKIEAIDLDADFYERCLADLLWLGATVRHPAALMGRQ